MPEQGQHLAQGQYAWVSSAGKLIVGKGETGFHQCDAQLARGYGEGDGLPQGQLELRLRNNGITQPVPAPSGVTTAAQVFSSRDPDTPVADPSTPGSANSR